MVNRSLTAAGFGVKRTQLVAHASNAEQIWACLFYQGPGSGTGIAKQHGFEIRGLSGYVPHAVHGHHGQFLEPLQGAFHEIPSRTTAFELRDFHIGGLDRQHCCHEHNG